MERGKNNFGVPTVATVARPWGFTGPPSGDGSYICGSCFSRVPMRELHGASVVVQDKVQEVVFWIGIAVNGHIGLIAAVC
jgi:hypothetical protein